MHLLEMLAFTSLLVTGLDSLRHLDAPPTLIDLDMNSLITHLRELVRGGW